MLLSENMNTLTKDWALKRIGRTPIIKVDIFTKSKLDKIEKALLKYKALLAIVFLLLAQFALYDFDIAEYVLCMNISEYISKYASEYSSYS